MPSRVPALRRYIEKHRESKNLKDRIYRHKKLIKELEKKLEQALDRENKL